MISVNRNDIEYIHEMIDSITKYINAICSLGKDLNFYFSESIFSFSELAPESIKESYTTFIASGTKFARIFKRYLDLFKPILDFYVILINKFDSVLLKLQQYRKLKYSSKKKTKKASLKETAALNAFKNELESFQQSSNDSTIGFVSIYNGAMKQLVLDLNNIVIPCFNEIASRKKYLIASKEEVELDEYIIDLKKEIEEQEVQKTKSEQNELSDFDLPQIKDDKNDINSRNLSMIKQGDEEFFNEHSLEVLNSPLLKNMNDMSSNEINDEEESYSSISEKVINSKSYSDETDDDLYPHSFSYFW